jgi:hypothetical protein
MKIKIIIPLLALFVIIATSFQKFQNKPVLYIIGDSTVQNGSGKGVIHFGDGEVLWICF